MFTNGILLQKQESQIEKDITQWLTRTSVTYKLNVTWVWSCIAAANQCSHVHMVVQNKGFTSPHQSSFQVVETSVNVMTVVLRTTLTQTIKIHRPMIWFLGSNHLQHVYLLMQLLCFIHSIFFIVFTHPHIYQIYYFLNAHEKNLSFKVIPFSCIAHPFCASFLCARTLELDRFSMKAELNELGEPHFSIH